MKTILGLVGSYLALTTLLMAEVRVWNDVKGRSVSAEMTGIQGDNVMLKLQNGRVVPYALAQLSTEDQAYARSQAAGGAASSSELTKGMSKGDPKLQSISQIAFGPGGILFIADTKAAAVIALATGDTAAGEPKSLKVEAVDQKIAALLGTSADQLLINDIAVNPVSRNVYVAISRGRGPDAAAVLVKLDAKGDVQPVSLDGVMFARAELPDAPEDRPAPGGGGKAGRPTPRMESITDIAFFEDQLLVAGLSNEEFSSSFRVIPFPFQKVGKGTSVEIFHGAHGKFETRSPVRTFIPFNVGKEPSLLAAYTCTPLVQIPIKDLSPGAKIKGKTIAELGNRNRPLDMIVYEKGGKQFVLMANSSRGIMKISMEGVEKADSITSKTDVAGQPYETIKEWTGVEQLDAFGSEQAMILRKEGESMLLETLSLP